MRGQRRQLQERRAGVEQPVDAIARQQLAALDVALARALAAAERDALELLAQVGDQRLVGRVFAWNSSEPGLSFDRRITVCRLHARQRLIDRDLVARRRR